MFNKHTSIVKQPTSQHQEQIMKIRIVVSFLCVIIGGSTFAEPIEVKEPIINRNYRYEESMKTSASDLPYQNYEVQGGGYYPSVGYSGGYGNYGGYNNYGGPESGRYFQSNYYPRYQQAPYVGGGYSGGNIGGYSGGNLGGYSGGNLGGYSGGNLGGYSGGNLGGYSGGGVGRYSGGLGYGPGVGSGFSGGISGGYYPHHGHNGGYLDKKYYDNENKKIDDEKFEKAEGSKGESGQHGSEGFKQGQIAVKDIKGDSGYYKDEEGDKKVVTDGKSYQGGQHYNEQGGKGEGENEKANHRKGFVKKGFKKSHHKDEAENEETFYDEAHDEGDKFHYNGNEGAFGTKGESAFKGGHEKGEFAADEKRKQGHFDRHHATNNANGDKGQYGQKGYHGSSEGYGVNNGVGQQSILGKQEANRVYHNSYPHGYIPIHPGF